MRRRNQSGNAEEIDQTAPSAPPIGHMDFVAGYDNVKFDNCEDYSLIARGSHYQ